MFEDMKQSKSYKYIIFKLNEHHTEIVVEKTSTSSEYRDFCADLPENECRWAVYDLEFKNDEGSKRNKIIFYKWYVSFFKRKGNCLHTRIYGAS